MRLGAPHGLHLAGGGDLTRQCEVRIAAMLESRSAKVQARGIRALLHLRAQQLALVAHEARVTQAALEGEARKAVAAATAAAQAGRGSFAGGRGPNEADQWFAAAEQAGLRAMISEQ